MPTITPDSDTRAGNEADSHNPSQAAYDAEFRRIAQAEELGDLNASLEEPYVGKNGEHVDSHGDIVEDNYNADLQKQEQNQNPVLGSEEKNEKTREGFGARLQKALRKNGASGSIIGLLVGGFVSSSFFLLPGSVLATIEKAMTNDASDATRTNIVMRRAYIGGLFSKIACKTTACEKLTKMSDTQKANWEKQGFKVELDEKRNLVSLEFPDGEKVRSAKEYDAKVKSSLSGRLSADKVVNIRSAFFQNAKFDKVLEKLGIKKSVELKASEDKDKAKRTEEMAKSFDENTHASTGDTSEARAAKIKAKTTESSTFRQKIDEIANSKGGKAGQFLNAATSAICTAYSVARLTTATVKAAYILDLVDFAFPYVQAAAQIYYYGSIKPELVEYLADHLTWYDKSGTKETNPKYGLTALDSQGLQMAIYGDFSKLKDFTAQYTTGILGNIIMGSNMVKTIQSTIGKENMHNICTVNSYVGVASSVFCVTNPLSAFICAAGAGAVILGGPAIAEKAVEELSAPAIKIIADANLTSSLRGVDAGNAIAAGIGLMLMHSSMAYGLMMAGNAADVKQFISMTNDDYYQYGEELARYEAKSEPFDVTNQYSFIGQLASSFNPYRSGDGTVFSQILNGFSFISSPFTKVSSTANALYSQPSNMTLEKSSDPTKDSASNRLAKMPDPDMEAIGAVNDWSGRFVGITPPAVLGKMAGQAIGSNTAIADTIDYMTENGYINDDGSPKSGSEYEDYIKYWDNRQDPPGTTSESVSEGSGDKEGWFTAENMVYNRNPAKQAMIENFIIYNNMCETQLPTAESSVGGKEVTDCSKAPQTTSPSTTPATTPSTPSDSKGTIAIDPGHSANNIHTTESVTGADLFDYPNHPELEDALDVANRVKSKLEKDGYTVKMLRTSNDQSVGLQERANQAKGSAMVVSIHTNNNGDNSVAYQMVGGWRTKIGGGPKLEFKNADVAAKSKQCAEVSGAARGASVHAGNDFSGREGQGIAPGNLSWVQLLAQDTPWIYHEMAPPGGGGGSAQPPMSDASKQKYADDIVAGLEKCNLPKGAANSGITNKVGGVVGG